MSLKSLGGSSFFPTRIVAVIGNAGKSTVDGGGFMSVFCMDGGYGCARWTMYVFPHFLLNEMVLYTYLLYMILSSHPVSSPVMFYVLFFSFLFPGYEEMNLDSWYYWNLLILLKSWWWVLWVMKLWKGIGIFFFIHVKDLLDWMGLGRIAELICCCCGCCCCVFFLVLLVLSIHSLFQTNLGMIENEIKFKCV